MSAEQATAIAKDPQSHRPTLTAAIEQSVQDYGRKLLDLMDAAGPPSIFSRKGLYSSLMEWAIKDEHFKTQLFRFVDVLPSLNSSSEISRHLREYLGDEATALPPALRLGLKAASGAAWLFGSGVKAQVTGLAGQFMLGDEAAQILSTLRKLRAKGIAFTADVLGETVVSEAEADQYAKRYLDLMVMLAEELRGEPPCRSDTSPRGDWPSLNLSVKISALDSQILPTNPEGAIATISERLRPILRRARELNAFINLDMEHYALKDLTLALFKTIFAEPEFAAGPACGLALQAYLKDTATDLRDLIAWGRERRRPFTVRLVKGAYWDYETIIAAQRHWPTPVFGRKAETDANFEELALVLLENADAVNAAFGTHNVRSIAYVLAQAQRLGLDPRGFEFQMLHGMADSLKTAVLALDCRLREYCPVGELLPGMAYLVRRLLENTSNEGFLANKFAKAASAEQLLRNPGDELRVLSHPARAKDASGLPSNSANSSFRNEPHTDFRLPAARAQIQDALERARRMLGRRYSLIINHKAIATSEWLPSLNPANQEEIIGYAAQGSTKEADAAVASARAAQPAWARMPAEDRAATLERTAALMRRDKALLCALEILEAGKDWAEADADVAEAIDFCNYYAVLMRRLGRSRCTQTVAGETNVQHWWARGVGVIIAPWNFPLAILTGMASAALVSGNAVVLKPSDQTPVIAAWLMELLMEAGLPPGVANLLTGPGSTMGSHLVAHPGIDFVAFTGSKEVGLNIWETAARTIPGQRQLKKVICEMGGKNCVIVDSDADLDEAVLGCVTSAFGYQGQKCSALSRLVVLEDNYEKFLARLIAAAASLRIGPAEAPANRLGPVISRAAQQRILGVIEAGKHEARLAWQGTVPEEPRACYVPPTVFTEVPAQSRLFREEIFGPVLSVSRARNFEEALALANDCEFALTGGCYSRSPAHLDQARREMVCGNLYLNRAITGALVERQPFGGFGMSGGGTKAGGPEYLENFMVPRVVTENCLRRGFAPEEENIQEL